SRLRQSRGTIERDRRNKADRGRGREGRWSCAGARERQPTCGAVADSRVGEILSRFTREPASAADMPGRPDGLLGKHRALTRKMTDQDQGIVPKAAERAQPSPASSLPPMIDPMASAAPVDSTAPVPDIRRTVASTDTPRARSIEATILTALAMLYSLYLA